MEDALAAYGKREIFNTGQGSQFTGTAFTSVLIKNDIKISMDGKGAWRDNVFVERLWRSVKYEEVYLRAYDSVGEARESLGRYLDLYYRRHPRSSLDDRTPDQAYFTNPLGSLTPADVPLIEAGNAVRRSGTTLFEARYAVQTKTSRVKRQIVSGIVGSSRCRVHGNTRRPWSSPLRRSASCRQSSPSSSNRHRALVSLSVERLTTVAYPVSSYLHPHCDA